VFEDLPTLSGLLFFAAFTILVMVQALPPVILVGVGVLCALVFAATIAVPIRWLVPWLLVSAGVVWAIYTFRDKPPEDWEGDFILIAGAAPYIFGVVTRGVFWGLARLRTMSSGYSG